MDVTLHPETEAEAAPAPAPAASDEAAPATPSEQLIAQAITEDVVEDGKGRKLSIRKPGPLAQFRLIEALGDLAANQTYMQMCNPLLWLNKIDGQPVPMPKNKLEVEALIQRLDDEGLAALMSWYMVNVLGPTQDSIDAAQRAAAQRDAIKN